MAEDITSLQIRILYDQVDKAEARLKKLETTGRKSEKGIDDLGSTASKTMGKLAALAGSVLSVAAAVNGLKAVVETTRNFQVLQASLETATGSVENMEKAWKALLKFASTTPFSLDQSVTAFTKLVNYGLTPSERALRSYGDTAAATSKSFDDMVEAVADAVNGEFERIKNAFNVKAKNMGDTVEFRFRGVVTTVKNNAKEIEEYFLKLGETNFAGAMEKRMQTLDGAISNLGDTWEQLKYALGEAGIGDAAETGIRDVTAALGELREKIASGELGTLFDNLWRQISEGNQDIGKSFQTSTNELMKFVGLAEVSADEWEAYWSEVFNNFPASIAYMVKRAGNELGTFVSIVAAVAEDAATALVANMSAGFRKVSGLMQEAASWAPGAAPFDLDAHNAETDRQYNGSVGNDIDATIKAIWEDREDNNEEYAKQYQESLDKTEQAIADSKWKRHLWEEENNGLMHGPAREGELDPWEADELGSLLPPPGAVSGSSTSGGGSSKPKKKRSSGGSGGGSRESEFDRLKESLRNEETLIAESYARRYALIEANTREGSAMQAELELNLTDQFMEEQERRLDKLKQEPETMFQAFAEEEALIKQTYEKRREIIPEATELTEEAKLKLLEEAELKYTQQMRKHETERNKMALDLASDFFGNISQIAGAFGKKGSKIAKAAAIAQTTIKTYESATSAYAAMAGIPYVGPALGAVAAAAAVAAGVANIQKIRSTDDSGGYSGAYEHGGMIPAGGFGLVGEAGPELVRGPAMVTSAANTRDRYLGGGDAGGGGNVNISIINQAPGVEVERKVSGDEENRRIELTIKRIKSDVRRGGISLPMPLNKALNYGEPDE